MRINIADFRCFHQPNPVEIRPINILVGENSAGKTSFLAAVRFLFDLFKRETAVSFNKDPFHLGSYEHIAHFRGGRFGRAKSFSFEMYGTVPRLVRRRHAPDLFESSLEAGEAHTFRLRATFEDYKSQPALTCLEFEAARFGFQAKITDEISMILSTPSAPKFDVPDRYVRGEVDPFAYDVSFIEYILRDMRFFYRRLEVEGRQEPSSLSSEFAALADLYSDVLRMGPRNVYASAPVRSKPERTYNPTDFTAAADGGHIPYVLAQMSAFEPKAWQEIADSLSEFGKASGLFDSVYIRQVGKSASGPFQLIVDLPKRRSNIIDVGYGVSQALPIVADVLRMPNNSMFLFQQPEVHLHPKAQAELGSFFVSVLRKKRSTFFVETHSDYLIDRIRMEVRDGGRVRPQDVSILYFDREGHDVQIHSLSIDKKGNILGAPRNYRRFFLEEESRSLGAA